MNDNEYLQAILRSQTLAPDSEELNALQEERAKVEKLDFIRGWAAIWACQFHDAEPGVKDWWKLQSRKSA